MSSLLLLLISFFSHILLPLAFLSWFAFHKGKSRLYKISVALFVAIFLFTMKLDGAGWHLFGFWWPILFVILLVPAGFLSIRHFRNLPWLPQRKFLPWLKISVLFIITAFFFTALMEFILLHKYEDQPFKLMFPLNNGTYYIGSWWEFIGRKSSFIAAQKYACICT